METLDIVDAAKSALEKEKREVIEDKRERVKTHVVALLKDKETYIKRRAEFAAAMDKIDATIEEIRADPIAYYDKLSQK